MPEENKPKEYVMRGSRHAGFFSIKADESVQLEKYSPDGDAKAFYEAFFRLPARTALKFVELLRKKYPAQMGDLPDPENGNQP